jgi:hypothetical protein
MKTYQEDPDLVIIGEKIPGTVHEQISAFNSTGDVK